MGQLLDMEIVASIRDLSDFDAEDNFARELFEVFSRQSELIMEGLEAAMTTGDLKQVRHLAHRLKGSAANIGACELSHQAETIEQLVQTGSCDAQGLQGAVRDLMPLCRNSIQVLGPLLLAEPH